jgi:hypothetical protein
MWHFWAAALSVLLIVLGLGSAIAGSGVVAGATWARRLWPPLVLLALVVHTLWVLARLLPRRLTGWTFLWFGLVCTAYVVLWAHQRSFRTLHPARAAARF